MTDSHENIGENDLTISQEFDNLVEQNVLKPEKMKLRCTKVGEEKLERFVFEEIELKETLAMKDVRKALMNHWNIRSDEETSRLWISYLGSPWKVIKAKKTKLSKFVETNFVGQQESMFGLILEHRRFKEKYQLDFLSDDDGFKKKGGKSSIPYYKRYDHTKNTGDGFKHPPGYAGLENLGNTCYMNSTIQVLFKIAELRDYFVSDQHKKDLEEKQEMKKKKKKEKKKKSSEEEIDEDSKKKKKKKKNKGEELIDSFAEVMKMIWSGKHTEIAPRGLKYRMGKIREEFSGYRQQDSHEFLSSLISSLHETLYNSNLPKNQRSTIISSLFRGYALDTLKCPICQWSRQRLGLFNTLQLPIPVKNLRNFRKRNIFVTVVFNNFSNNNSNNNIIKTPIRYEVECDVYDTIFNLRKNLSTLCGVPADNLLVVEIHRKKIFKYFEKFDLLDDIMDTDNIFAFELNSGEEESKEEEEEEKKKGNYNEEEKKKGPLKFIEFRLMMKQRKKKYSSMSYSYYDDEDGNDADYKTVSKKMMGWPLLYRILPEKKVGLSTQEIYDFCFRMLFGCYGVYVRKQNIEDDEDEESIFPFPYPSEENVEKMNILEYFQDQKKQDQDQEQQDYLFKLKIKPLGESSSSSSVFSSSEEEDDFFRDSSYASSSSSSQKPEYLKYSKDEYIDVPEEPVIEGEDNNNNNNEDDFGGLYSGMNSLFSNDDDYSYYTNNTSLETNKNNNNDVPKKIRIDIIVPSIFSIFLDDTIKSIDVQVIPPSPMPDVEEENNLENKKEEFDDGILTLRKCLQKYCEEEELTEENKFKCPKCEKDVQIIKKIELYEKTLPKVLIIQLKRFQNFGGGMYSDKIEDKIEFPKLLDLKDFVCLEEKDDDDDDDEEKEGEEEEVERNFEYELFGVTNHFGDLHGGHYTCFVKSIDPTSSSDGAADDNNNNEKKDEEEWMEFNDSLVNQVRNLGDIEGAEDGYVLFYRRRSF